MPKQNSVVCIYNSHTDADEAVKTLQKGGFNMKQLSIVGKDYHTEEHAVGYYNSGDRMKYWGKLGAFWGGLWGLLFGSAFFWIPGIGPLVAAGPVVAWIMGGVEGAALVGGLGALGGAFAGIGVPKDSVVKYETAIKTGKYLLLANGTADEIASAKDLLKPTSAADTATYG